MSKVFFALILGCFLASGCAHAEGGAPQIKCEIGTAIWCIATFDGSINMVDAGQTRIWTLQSRTVRVGQSMRITETKACSSNAYEMVHLAKANAENDPANDAPQVYEYTLNSSGCSLQFEVPSGEGSSTYKQVMKFGILVGPAKQTQLYGAKEQ